jgi:hypothetical protein
MGKENNQFEGVDRQNFLNASNAISSGATANLGTPEFSSSKKRALAKRLIYSATFYLGNITRRY